jgi:hypothetical protein
VIRRFAALGLVALAACGGPDDPPSADRTVCEVRFAAPTGFGPLSTFEEDYPDHVGLRQGFEDDRGREFYVLTGIPGEIGEGLPFVEELALTEGRSGRFLGRDDVWVVVWTEDDECDPRAVIGNGFTRADFVAALADAGLAPAEPMG